MVSLDTEEDSKVPAESAPVIDHLALNQQSNSYTSAQSVTEANNQREDEIDNDDNELDEEEEDIDDELDIEKTKEGLWTLLTG